MYLVSKPDTHGLAGSAIDEDVTSSRWPDGDNSTRSTVRGVELKPGDVLRVEGTPDGNDPAALDLMSR